MKMQNVHTIQNTAAIMPLISSASALTNLYHLMSALNLDTITIEKGQYGAKFTSANLDKNIDGASKTNVLAFVSIANQMLSGHMSRPLLASKVKASRGKKKQNINQFLADNASSSEFIETIGKYVDADTVLYYFEQTGLDTTLPIPGILTTTFIEVSVDALFDACNNIKTNIIPQAKAQVIQSRSAKLQ